MQIKKISAVIAAAAVTAAMGVTAFAEDNIDDGSEAEEVSIYDEIRRGEGYYECHVSYRGGVPQIYDEDGVEYGFPDVIGGNLNAGETRESVENKTIESIKAQFVSIGANPNDYPFDVYTYFYDDYDLTPEEFLGFIGEDIARRENGRTAQTEEVPNPVTGTALPCGAAALAALSAICLAAADKKKFS